MRLALALGLAVSNCGCIMGPPDTFRDMERRIGDLSLPPDAVHIATTEHGLRSRFAGASPPSLHYAYAIPWADDTCGSLPSIVSDASAEDITTSDDPCSLEARIPSGFRAHLVNVRSYKLLVVPESPERVASQISDVDCDEMRSKDLSLYTRYHLGCWVEPGFGILRVALYGKSGW